MSNPREPALPEMAPYLRRRTKPFKDTAASIAARELPHFRNLFKNCIPDLSRFDIRNRCYTTQVIVWAWIWQMLGDLSCQAVVNAARAWRQEAGLPLPKPGNSGYCRARKRLSAKALDLVHTSIVNGTQGQGKLWHGRRVVLVDGSGLSMPDTEPNQDEYPQQARITKGCGFPEMRIVATICWATGLVLTWRSGNKHDSEHSLWRKQWDDLAAGMVMVADSLYDSFAHLAGLAAREVDCIFRFGGSRKVDFRSGKHLGKYDRLITVKRPSKRSASWEEGAWQALPESLTVRIIKVQHQRDGFRPIDINIITTLLDPEVYPAAAIVALYADRWQIELMFRDIKITLGADILTCNTPAMIKKELAIAVIAHNLVRNLLLEASGISGECVRRMSFAAALDALVAHLPQCTYTKRNWREIRQTIAEAVAAVPIPLRPGRSEPRVIKRRRHKFTLMTRPRSYHRKKIAKKRSRAKAAA
jgi:hypothetical protein